MLHPDAGLADDAGGNVIGPAAPLEQLIADAHDQRQKQQLEQHPQADAAPRQHAVEEHADDDHQNEEAGAAARMEPSVLAHILHGQLITGLIAGNGLVLGTVVLKHAVDLLHLGDGHHIGEEDANFQHRFQHHLGPAAQCYKVVHAAHDEGGQHGEQQNRQQAAQYGGTGQQCVLCLFAQVVAHPFFKGSLFLFGVVVVTHAHLSRVHHVAVAHDQAFDHGDGTAHQRDLCPDAVVLHRVDLGLNGAVRLAHGAADELRAAHHDAFHQRLPADAGLETFLFWLIHWVLLSDYFFPGYFTTEL